MEKKQVILIIKTVAIITAVIGAIILLKKDLGATLMVVLGSVAFYFADRS